MSPTHPPLLSLDEIEAELHDCETAEERLEYLVELGATLPEFPAEDCIEEHRVLGCQSMVWLVPRFEGERIVFQATSDAPMVRGLIAILLAAYSGKPAKEILAFDIDDFFSRIRLKTFITPLRSNGLHSMIVRVREIAKATGMKSKGLPTGPGGQAVEEVSHSFRALDAIRDDFPILQRHHPSSKPLVYLDNAATSQRPTVVLAAMDQAYREYYSNVHRSGHQLAAETTSHLEASRQAIARFIHAESSEQIVLTSGTTAAINLVAHAWGEQHLKAGDEILLTEMEHHSNIVPWQMLAVRKGAVVRWLPIDDQYQLDLDQLRQLLTSRTKVLSITAVSNVLGTINPIREIVELAHHQGTMVLVDAAQAVPHGAVDVAAWGADFVAFSGHKMLGPTGIGVLYGQRQQLEALPPFLGGGNMIHSVTKEGFQPANIPHRFEAGTPPIVEAIGMRPAVEYLEAFGHRQILDHEQMLTSRVHQRLSQLKGLRVFGPPPSQRSGIVTFVLDGQHPSDVGTRLDMEGIAIRVGHHCAMPLHQRLGVTATCRASFYLYNTIEEVDRFCEAIEKIAGHSAFRSGEKRT